METGEEDYLSVATRQAVGKRLVRKCLLCKHKDLSLESQRPHGKACVVCFPAILVTRRQKQEDPRDC